MAKSTARERLNRRLEQERKDYDQRRDRQIDEQIKVHDEAERLRLERSAELVQMGLAYECRENILGLWGTILMCDETPGISLPPWAVHALAEHLRQQAAWRRRDPGAKRPTGRNARPLEPQTAAAREFIHYKAVEFFRSRPRARNRGGDVYEQVKTLLKGTPADASRETIKRHFHKASRAIKAGDTLRHYFPRLDVFAPELQALIDQISSLKVK